MLVIVLVNDNEKILGDDDSYWIKYEERKM